MTYKPIPDEPKAQPAPEGPLVDGTPVKEGDVLYYVGEYKPFIGSKVVAVAHHTWSPDRVRHGAFTRNDGGTVHEGWLWVNTLSRTKPVIIEGRVVKPGDVLYYKPTTPHVWGQERTVSVIRSADTLEFTNGGLGSP